MRRYAVAVPEIPGYAHTGCFSDLAEIVQYGLVALGHDAVLTNTLSTEGRQSIVFGSHLLSADAELAPDSIIYNWEQVGAPSMPPLALLHQFEVWDFSARNVAFWRAHGINAHHVPLGYAPQMTRVARSKPDIDVLFYGSMTNRRQTILDHLRTRGLHVHHAFGVFGPARDVLIGRSKVVLNLHCFDAHVTFESARVVYALSNEVCVVSESGEEDDAFRDAAVIVPYEELVDACVLHVQDATLRLKQAARGLAIVRTIPESECLRARVAS